MGNASLAASQPTTFVLNSSVVKPRTRSSSLVAAFLDKMPISLLSAPPVSAEKPVMSDNDSQISRDVPIYGRLDTQRSQIRLLEMNETVSGADWKLSVVSLEDRPRFTALSYAWGTSAENEEIRLNGQVVPIKGNLAYALRHVYQHWVDAFTDEKSRQMFHWADALCIDQNDVEEKSSQVPLMGTIFSRAELVMSWLGRESDSLYCALDTIEMLYSEWSEKDDISDLRWILYHPSLCDVWTDERDDSWINTRWEAM